MVARSSFLSSVNRFHLELFFAGFRCFAGVTIIVTTDTKVVGRDLSLSLEYVTATVKKKVFFVVCKFAFTLFYFSLNKL
jgi:hypothetical protein